VRAQLEAKRGIEKLKSSLTATNSLETFVPFTDLSNKDA